MTIFSNGFQEFRRPLLARGHGFLVDAGDSFFLGHDQIRTTLAEVWG